MEQINQILCELLRSAMKGDDCQVELSADEWMAVYHLAHRQSLAGVIYAVASHHNLPMPLAIQWTAEAETIRGLNQLLNDEAQRLTALFAQHGRHSVILKGQANARLYPDKFLRQPGDIDIWVEGGRENVVALTHQLFGEFKDNDVSAHHVHLPVNERGVTVEVHFKPTSMSNPLARKRLLSWLDQEVSTASLTPEGFCVPSIRYALAMQLSHIQMHFMVEGMGLRHISDYYCLLQQATAEDREVVGQQLKRFGLRHTAGALMWVLGEVLHLEKELMLCEPDSYRGAWMLREVMEGGNFGRGFKQHQHGIWRQFFERRWRSWGLLRFDAFEVCCTEVAYAMHLLRSIPERIRRRSFSLAEANKRDARK